MEKHEIYACLAILVAAADGEASMEELTLIQSTEPFKLALTDDYLEVAISWIKENSAGVIENIKDLVSGLELSNEERKSLITGLMEISMADNDFSEGEIALVVLVSNELGMPEDELLSIQKAINERVLDSLELEKAESLRTTMASGYSTNEALAIMY